MPTIPRSIACLQHLYTPIDSLRILAVRLLKELTGELFGCNAAATLGIRAITDKTVVQRFQVEPEEDAAREELLVVLVLVFLVVRIDAIIGFRLG